jgi:F0F1-type ATP synthase assembly protein I
MSQGSKMSDTSSGWVASSSFFGSILSGTLLGYFGDRIFDTKPILILVGFGLGAYSGFMRLWAMSKEAK